MTISEYIKYAWQVHDREASRIFLEMEEKLAMVNDQKELLGLANLATHISTDHLYNWKKGLELLDKIKSHPLASENPELLRLSAILSLCLDSKFLLSKFSISDQARIYASTAGALKNEHSRANHYLEIASKIALDYLEKSDAAQRTLAITCNNLAAALEEKSDRSAEETALMLKCAHYARVFWEIAGNWMNVERAEYRLSRSYFKAGDFKLAQGHALKCLEIVVSNGNDPLELFFAYEILVLSFGKDSSYVSSLQEIFAKLNEDDQKWCLEYMNKVLS